MPATTSTAPPEMPAARTPPLLVVGELSCVTPMLGVIDGRSFGAEDCEVCDGGTVRTPVGIGEDTVVSLLGVLSVLEVEELAGAGGSELGGALGVLGELAGGGGACDEGAPAGALDDCPCEAGGGEPDPDACDDAPPEGAATLTDELPV